eukprot:CAMPEP_0184720302 /NCGR_PEP_ID=MMETSP0314-20130426/11889_1 /TAXON_ID=38298 /ORGANISM="Rhodella maculata, Strain CCMP 736" /LENGTH=55 /DNA_ID=CAMNT_0027184355 /DNA_START=46 /DNA_END=210 /DNA_ORIENTATION=-
MTEPTHDLLFRLLHLVFVQLQHHDRLDMRRMRKHIEGANALDPKRRLHLHQQLDI